MRLSPEQAMVPLVTAAHDGRRRVIVAADPTALGLGLRPGMAVAQAITMIPELTISEAEPEADAAALKQLALWFHRVTPLVAVDPPDALWLDVAGCTHLWGGEATLLHKLLDRLRRDGLRANVAMADTPGAAHALARYGPAAGMVIPPGRQGAAITELPVAALRLPSDLATDLQRMGFDEIHHLARFPRALLARRFGLLPGLRLDQANGCAAEPWKPLAPEHLLQRRATFLEPLLTTESLAMVTDQLMEPLCKEMEDMGLGARQVDLLFERVDQILAIRVGTTQPSRDARHLTRLIKERLDAVDPGHGIEAMRLVIPMAQPLQWEQHEGGPSLQDIARLIDKLANRLNTAQIYQATPLESEIPDRSVKHAEPLVSSSPNLWMDLWQHQNLHPQDQSAKPELLVRPKTHLTLVVSEEGYSAPKELTPPPYLYLVKTSNPVSDWGDPPLIDWKQPWEDTAANGNLEFPWPRRLHAPARLFNPPRRIEALAGLPDQPPSAFTWRRRRYRVHRTEGPERVHEEWWRHNYKLRSIRDYYQVEDRTGQRFWLFREGNGQDLTTGGLSWFLHGLF